MKALFHRARTAVVVGALLAGAVVLSALALVGDVPAADAVFEPKIDKLTHTGYSETMPDSKVKFDMVPIPGGTFWMGSPKDEKDRAEDEGPQHPVQIKPFWMGKTEVTWDEFDVFRKEMAAENKEENVQRQKKDPDALTGPTKPYVDETYGHGRDGHPALCMTQHAAMEYCRWLSKKTKKAYRLPTEAEWEYAARAGTKTAYFFGDDPKDLGDYAWYVKNSPVEKDEDGVTHVVATRKPNPWGLYDMYGNVMEWCIDHYEKDGYSKFPANALTIGPVVLPTDKRFSHVARGGSWNDEAPKLRSAARRGSDKTWIKDDPQRPQSLWWLTRFDVVGFRIVRAVEEQDNLKNLRSKITLDSD
jgi:formylglycine-generating enzyme required for sulfatase activity